MTTEHPEFEAYLAKVKFDRGLSEKNGTQNKWKNQLISALIHLTYSQDDETAILRQKYTDPDAYDAWYKYAEDAKDYAYEFIYGRNRGE